MDTVEHYTLDSTQQELLNSRHLQGRHCNQIRMQGLIRCVGQVIAVAKRESSWKYKVYSIFLDSKYPLLVS